MSILTSLLPASFRGVSFYCVDSSMDSGRKQVTHEFPNSDKRYVEDLGRFQNVFKIQALVSGNVVTYLQNRNALIAALEQAGTGLLVHPFYGSVEVVPKQFTVQENIGRLGEATFSLTFEKAQSALTPQGDTTNFQRVNLLANNMLASLALDVANVFTLFGNYPNNFLDAQNIIASIANAFGVNTRIFTQALDTINQFNTLLDDYETSANQLILNPVNLGTRTMDLYSEVDNLITSPNDRLNVYKQFYDYGNDLEVVPPTTFERIQRQSNRDVMQAVIQGGALTQSYRSAAEIDYGNIRELNVAQSQLENQYQVLADNPSLSDTTKLALQNLRNETRLFFENEKLNINQITSIETNRQPLTTLAYQYYGNTDNVEALNNLNNIRNNAFVEGSVDILTN